MTATTTGTSASAVSAALRRAGLRPVGDRRREGIRVARGAVGGHVHVTIGIDTPSRRNRLHADAHEALTDAGYTIVDSTVDADYASVTVTR